MANEVTVGSKNQLFFPNPLNYTLINVHQKLRVMFIIQFQKSFSSFNRNLPNIHISSKQASSNAPTLMDQTHFLHCLHCDGITHTGTNALNKHLAKFFYYDLFLFIPDTVATHLEHWSKKREKEGEKENKESLNSASTLPLTVTSMRVVW